MYWNSSWDYIQFPAGTRHPTRPYSFFKKDRIITKLVADSSTEDLVNRHKANSLIVDELGKSLLLKGFQPQVPPSSST